MKQKETLLSTQPSQALDIDDMEDDHVATSYETPLRADAFEMDDDLKMELIAKHFREIMHILGMDLTDDSLKGTPNRVAKMYVKEVFSGLNPKNKPTAKLFDNKYEYNEMLVERDITFYSYCEHHFVPIYGKAHVAYISSGKVIGLSKINRIVQYYAKRPQVQERMTVQIANELKKILKTDNVGVVVDAVHMCVSSRGVGDTNSRTGTAHFSGKFSDENTKKEFLNYINTPNNLNGK
ncbi:MULTISPECIES: GTP cyclohydrolase I FolE [unclassified Imperialibacter]|uniref:GTP cyclohydrolase I FolE n=1 Tax=unclassified Imperialibacter TaxID=2629706 RepID=UPI001252CABA|nr:MULTISPECIES: GTP cyclohydrolase I FolE [unclassified Imperialibacter]CAD5257902.1 GTP cyclohydrolase I [Imperialibacter sp. 89]CAD5272911.1 GTP cyclohydrolase I [Imperialibacter sp. 75]VVT32489.1 GTP cyclohydrolase I [Imperialibacter sp. EC-SDR9]